MNRVAICITQVTGFDASVRNVASGMRTDYCAFDAPHGAFTTDMFDDLSFFQLLQSNFEDFGKLASAS